MKPMTKKQAEAMKLKITKAVTGIPGIYPCGGMYEFRLETKYGLLRLSCGETSIRTRFDDNPPKDAILSGAPLNLFSGKWNFEFSNKPTQEELDYAIKCIKEVIA